MKKTFLHLSVLMLALVMLFTMFVGCNKLDGTLDTGNTDNPPVTTPTQITISLEEIFDASRAEALLKNHENIYIRNETDGEFVGETYLTKDYTYDYILDEKFTWGELVTYDVIYRYDGEAYVHYVYITPDGVTNFASERADTNASVIWGEDAIDEIIESVSKKDGRITVTSSMSQKAIEDMAELGVTSGKFEYVLDEKTREVISMISNYIYDDGSAMNVVTELTYDTEVPEMLKEFLDLVNQTENLRNITVVSSPGTEKEEIKTLQIPKGMIMGFEFDEAFTDAVEFFTDAACTEGYDPYADTDSDLTIYVKWTKS